MVGPPTGSSLFPYTTLFRSWELQRGVTVTDAAFGAGYDSVDGFSRAFSRAFGCPPSKMPAIRERGHWLPAPNGIHFHSPTVLYADAEQEQSAGDVVMLMAQHDIDDRSEEHT